MDKINNLNISSLKKVIPTPIEKQSTEAASTPILKKDGPDTFQRPGIFSLASTGSSAPGSSAPGSTPAGTLPAGSTPPPRTTQAEYLYTLTTDGNFETISGNDGDVKTITLEDIRAQFAKDEAAVTSGSIWDLSAPEAAQVLKRRHALERLEQDFNQYGNNGKIDLKTLQQKYHDLTTGGSAPASSIPSTSPGTTPLGSTPPGSTPAS